jgi:hypothetical protein
MMASIKIWREYFLNPKMIKPFGPSNPSLFFATKRDRFEPKGCQFTWASRLIEPRIELNHSPWLFE